MPAGSLEAEEICFQATGRQHPWYIIPQAVTRSLVLLKMGGFNARIMLSWLELLINCYCCIYLVFISFRTSAGLYWIHNSIFHSLFMQGKIFAFVLCIVFHFTPVARRRVMLVHSKCLCVVGIGRWRNYHATLLEISCLAVCYKLCTHVFNLKAPYVLYVGQAFRCSPENAFYIFNQQIYFIIWYLLDRASLI